MSGAVLDPTNWADRAVGAVRGLVGSTGRPPQEQAAPRGRWLVVTIYRQIDDVRTQVDGSGPLSRMRDEIELTVRPAPGDKGTELAVRPTAPDGGSVDLRRSLRAALRDGQRYVPELLDRIARGEISTSHLATHVMSLDDGPRGYDMFKNKEDGCVRSVFRPG
jgi:threonine dehydrogenase-like Zn-dependent dehydrogenase